MKLIQTNIVTISFFLLFGLSCTKDDAKISGSGFKNSLAKPTDQQVEYQRKEMVAFAHFGINTFTNREWGTGEEDPDIFNPSDFDADQWVRTLSETGFKTLILTAKHHDGFCLWPSDYTDHDVANSPYRNGNGDIVKEVAEACRKYGIDFGVYLSPWDMHEPSYGTPDYNRFYENQLEELLTNYGPIAEVWFDGAKGEDAKDMSYDFESWRAKIRQWQPNALMFSDAGPDIRWIGNEHGFAGTTNWSTIHRDSVTIGKPGQGPYLNSGQKGAPHWVPGECDVSIRPGWFYHPGEDDEVKTVDELMEIYFKSVGRNCTLLLNIPPDKTGQFHETDVDRLQAFSERRERIFKDDLTKDATASSAYLKATHLAAYAIDQQWSTYWMASDNDTLPHLSIQFDQPQKINLISLQEYIPLGQRVSSFRVEIKNGESWREISHGTTIGHKRILKLQLPEQVESVSEVRIVFEEYLGLPAISNISVFHANEELLSPIEL